MVSVRQLHGGWGAFTFLVDDDHILRFARGAAVVAAHRKEAALLPKLAASVSFRVPEPDFFGAWEEGSCIGYPAIPGRPLTAAGTAAAWRDRHERTWADAAERALPTLDDGLRHALTCEYDAFRAAGHDYTPTLVHGDLAPDHVLVDDGGRVVGLIDFEDAAVGDPAVDFAGLLPLLGQSRLDRLIAAYGRPVDPARLRFYWRFAPVHDLLHGIDTGSPVIVASAVEQLRARFT